MLSRIRNLISDKVSRFRRFNNRGISICLALLIGLCFYLRYATDLNLFLIKDADSTTIYKTYAKDPQTALDEAGIHISKFDYLSLPKSSDGPGGEIQIRRGITVDLVLHGIKETVNAYTPATVRSLLQAGDDTRDLHPDDVVSPDLDTPLEIGMTVTVSRVTTEVVTETEVIAFKTKIHNNTNMREGTQLVTQKGKAGEIQRNVRVTTKDGEVFSREVIKEEITQKMQPKIIQKGVFVPTPTPPPTPTPRPENKPREVEPNWANNPPDVSNLSYKKVLEVTATAYSTEGMSNKLNAIGKICRTGTIAVDPRVIPLGSTVYVQSTNGSWIYGTAVCEDTGGVIKGNKIDLYFDTQAECRRFGVRRALVYLVD